MDYETDQDQDYDQDIDNLPDCPRCHSNDGDHKGGDWLMNLGSGWQRVDWYTCNECGLKFSTSEP